MGTENWNDIDKKYVLWRMNENKTKTYQEIYSNWLNGLKNETVMGKNLICLLILLLASNIFLNAQEYVFKEGSASFKAKTPLISYEGISNNVKGTIDFKAGTLTFSVPVKFIKTGNEKRDEHMYELVEAEKYPNVVFKGKFVGGFNFKWNGTQSVQAKGDFSLAGTTR